MAQETPPLVRPDDPADVGKRPSFDGTNIVWSAVDAVEVAGLAESVRDTVGTALVAGAGVNLTVNDGGDTITVAAPIDDSQAFHAAQFWS